MATQSELQQQWEAAKQRQYNAVINGGAISAADQAILQYPNAGAYVLAQGGGSDMIQTSQPNVVATTPPATTAAPSTSTGFQNLVTTNQGTPATTTPPPAVTIGGNTTTTTPPATTPPATTTTPAVTPATTSTPYVAPTGAGAQAFNQNQQGTQAGTFATNNAANTAVNQNTTQNTQQSTAGTTNTNNTVTGQNQGVTTNVGTTTGEQSGTQTGTTGQTTTGQSNTSTTVNDTLGFGGLLKGAAGTAQANDAVRNTFLTDLVTNGGQAMGSQFDQAIRNSLTGPQMTGAGDSARARAAGYASAQIARNNTGDRLAAAQQLAGPSSLTSLVEAGNPYLGKTESTTGSTNATGFNNLVTNLTNKGTSTNTGTSANQSIQNTTGQENTSSNTTGSTVGSMSGTTQGTESTAGTASGASAQSSAGVAPQQQQVQTGGGCIICTVGIEHGLWKNKRILRKVVAYKLQRAYPKFHNAAAGYFRLFTPTAKFLLTHPRLARLSMPLARMVVYEELRVSGRRLPFKSIPWALHWTWHGMCSLVGRMSNTPRNLTDNTLTSVAKKHGVFFQIGG